MPAVSASPGKSEPTGMDGTGVTVIFLSVEMHLGGAEKSLLTVLHAPPPDGMRSLLICRPGADIGREARRAGIDVVEIPMLQHGIARQPVAYLLSLMRLLRNLRSYKPALVFADGWRAVPSAWPVSRWLRIPLIVHLRECLIPPSRLTRRMTASAQLITTVSHAQREFLQQASGLLKKPDRPPIATVHNGLDPATYLRKGCPPTTLRQSLGLSPEAVGVVLPGYLLPHKGADDFLDAARLVMEEFPRLQFFLLGGPYPDTGSTADAIFPHQLRQRIMDENLSRRIHLLGHRDDVPDVLWAMDIAVVPTRTQEAFGRVAAEAMFAGKPVIASRLHGLAEVVEDGVTGLLITPGNAEALAKAIATLARDESLREAMGQRGQERALALFTAETKARKMWQLIKDTSANLP